MAIINGSVTNYAGNFAYFLDVYEIQTNVANNQSLVRVDVWLTSNTRSWESLSGVDGTVTISGVQHGFDKIVSIGAGGRVVLTTCDQWVTHDAAGAGSISISSTFNPTSSYSPGRCSASGSFALSTIPRASSLTSSANFVAGDNLPLSISRASSSFTHNIEVRFGSTLAISHGGYTTSGTITWTVAETKALYGHMGTAQSVNYTLRLITMSGGTLIGYKDYAGTITAPAHSTITTAANFTIGQALTVNLSRSRAAVTHKLTLAVGGTNIRQADVSGTAYTFQFTAAETAAIYAKTPNSNTVAVKLTCQSYHCDHLCGTVVKDGTATVNSTAARPIFGNFTFGDINSATTALTLDSQRLVSGFSTLQVTVPAADRATSTTGATIKKYIVSCGGKTAEIPYGASEVAGSIRAVTGGSIQVAAVDSRGNQTSVTKLADIIDYTPPKITTMTVRRQNNVDTRTRLVLEGTYWQGNFSAEKVNRPTAAYTYQASEAGGWSSETALPITIAGGKFTLTAFIDGDLGANGFTADASFDLLCKVNDLLSSAQLSRVLDRGIPTMHMTKDGIGVMKLHEQGSLDVAGQIAVTDSGLTTTMGCRNASHMHYFTDAPNHWFNKPVYVQGDVYGGNNYNRRLLYADELLNKIYPVGAVYISMVNTSPASFLGGTWSAIAAGRVLVGVDTSQAEFNAVNKSGGAKTHAHESGTLRAQIGAYDGNSASLGYTASEKGPDIFHYAFTHSANSLNIANSRINHATKVAGTSAAATNLQPYLTCYMWRRTA